MTSQNNKYLYISILLALTPFAKYIHYVNCMQGGDLSVRRVITLPPSCSNIKQGSDITLGLYASTLHLYIFAHARTLNRTRMQIYISFSNSQTFQLVDGNCSAGGYLLSTSRPPLLYNCNYKCKVVVLFYIFTINCTIYICNLCYV